MQLKANLNGKDYIFELTRNTYKMLMADKEYAKIQNEILKKMEKHRGEEDSGAFKASEEMVEENATNVILSNMITNEKVFYYGLLKHQPEMTMKEADWLIDWIFENDGDLELVSTIATKLLSSFFQGAKNKSTKRIALMEI